MDLHGRPKALSPGPREAFKSHAIMGAHTHTHTQGASTKGQTEAHTTDVQRVLEGHGS